MWVKVKLKDGYRQKYPYAPHGIFEVSYVSLLKSFTDKSANHWYTIDSLVIVDDRILKP